jgi:hypothetical protein
MVKPIELKLNRGLTGTGICKVDCFELKNIRKHISLVAEKWYSDFFEHRITVNK